MSIRLSFNADNIIYFDNNGDYEVPANIELPLMLERFEVVDGQIQEIEEYKNLSNEDLATLLEVKENFKVDEIKTQLLKSLWGLLPKKVIGSKKDIIGKPDMSDGELEVQIDLYRKKYDDAKAGLDVFEGQALAKGVTQEEYRQLIIAKGDNFLLGEKVINDRIELVRGLMEDKINAVETPEDIENIKNKFIVIEGFTIETPVQDIIDALS